MSHSMFVNATCVALSFQYRREMFCIYNKFMASVKALYVIVIHLLYLIFMLSMKAVHPFILINYFVYKLQRVYSCFINSLTE